MKRVDLERYEVILGAFVGINRETASLKSDEYNKVQNKDFGWHTNIEAACAEIAFAKFKGVYWNGSVNTFKRPDVAGYQVRHTRYTENGHLIIYRNDNPEEVFVLVTGTHPVYFVHGWMRGEDAMQQKYWREKNVGLPCWYVPQIDLLEF
jgi:hypothetical protein